MAGRANSSATRASARWCLTAWKLPMGRPNWWRSLAYAAVMASIRSARPSSRAAVPGGRPVGQERHHSLGRHAVGEEGVRTEGPVHRGQVTSAAERRRRFDGARRGRHGMELPARLGVPAGQEEQGGGRGCPTTRGVRSVPPADTSVGETGPPGVTSMPPTAKTASSSTSAASAATRRGRRGQGGQGRCGQRRRLEEGFGQRRPPGLLEHARPGRRRSGPAPRRPRARRARERRARPARTTG